MLHIRNNLLFCFLILVIYMMGEAGLSERGMNVQVLQSKDGPTHYVLMMNNCLGCLRD